MLKLRIVARSCLAALLVCASLCGFRHAGAQTTPAAHVAANTEQGIKLYRQGDVEGAIKLLREVVKTSKEDADAWYYLGLALNRADDVKGARKALESVLRLRPDFAPARGALAYLLLQSSKLEDAKREAELTLKQDPARPEAHYVMAVIYLDEGEHAKALADSDAALKSAPTMSAVRLLKARALVGIYSDKLDEVLKQHPWSTELSDEQKRLRVEAIKALKPLLREAADNVEAFLKVAPDDSDASWLRSYLETLRLYGSANEFPVGKEYSDADSVANEAGATLRRATITYKPTPRMPLEAMLACVNGLVRLRVLLDKDGTVKYILPLRTVSHGLTELAIQSARQVRFIPATLNGRPISQPATLEYNFRSCY